MTTPRVEFSTREYEFSHGRRPRGYGYWAFEIKEGGEEIKWFQGYLPAARKLAKAWAKAAAAAAGYNGDLTIEVLP